jgi:hypothetical protein
MPARAEAYSYHPIVGRISSTIDFCWGCERPQVIDASRITEWVVARVEADGRDRLDYLVDYQVGRLLSGLYPSYVSTGNGS